MKLMNRTETNRILRVEQPYTHVRIVMVLFVH